jgi:hypothetical protein
MINSAAAFDCLSIGDRLQCSLKNFAPGEVHLFAYLSCLLSLYAGNAASDWGYTFAGTRHGSPFSPEINDAVEDLVALGLLSHERGYLVVALEGQEEYQVFRQFSQNGIREKYLEAACSSLLSLPVGLIRSALSEEPMLRPSTKLDSTRALFAGPGLELLHEQFRALSSAIGIETQDLLVPATVWLTFLSHGSEEKVDSS